MKNKPIDHQFSMFPFQAPKKKVPISEDRIREAMAAIEKGDTKTAVQALRDVRYGLEAYSRKIGIEQ